MNTLSPAKAQHLYRMFSYEHGVRESARIAGVNRNTARRYRIHWLQHRDALQSAYDKLWDHDCDGCDAITEPLPTQMVIAMLDAWSDDQLNQPKSGFHSWFGTTP